MSYIFNLEEEVMKGGDVYTRYAAWKFGIDESQVTSDARNFAKRELYIYLYSGEIQQPDFVK